MNRTESIVVRAATIRDLKAIWSIEELSYSSPWPKETFFVDITFNADARYCVALVERRIAGFIGGWFKDGQLHIVNVATHPSFRRQGVAVRLVRFMIELASDLKMRSAFLEVRRSNSAAQRLYENLGFSVTGIKPMYYPDNLEDGLTMTKVLDDARSGD